MVSKIETDSIRHSIARQRHRFLFRERIQQARTLKTMLKPSAETLWARRRLAQDRRFSHLFQPISLPGVAQQSFQSTEEPLHQPLAEVVEIFPGAQATFSTTLNARRRRGQRPA